MAAACFVVWKKHCHKLFLSSIISFPDCMEVQGVLSVTTIVAGFPALPKSCYEYLHLVLNRVCALQKTATPDAAAVDDDVTGDEL